MPGLCQGVEMPVIIGALRMMPKPMNFVGYKCKKEFYKILQVIALLESTTDIDTGYEELRKYGIAFA